MLRTIACLTVLLVVTVAPAWAATYYVATTGDDASHGTSAEKPLKTISAAAAKVAPGDTIVVAPGTYAETVRIPVAGRADAPITLRKGEGDGEAVLTVPDPAPTNWTLKYSVQLIGVEHVIVDGLTFRNCGAWILIEGGSRNTVRNCTFDGADTYNCLRVNSSSFNRILDCNFVHAIKRTGFREKETWIPVPGADYIEIFRDSHSNLVQGCRFGPINHCAVSISAVDKAKFAPSRNIVRQCAMNDPYWKCLWVDNGPHNVIEDNTCSGNAACFLQLEAPKTIIRRNLFLRYHDSTGAQPDITLRGAVRMQYDAAQSNRIYANLFLDNERTLTNNSWRGNVTDNVFKNNIFFRNGQTIFLGFPDYRTKNRNCFVNNLVLGTGPDQKVIRLDKDDFTLAEAQKDLPELYRGNIAADPLLADAANDDFAIKLGSPCIDAGATLAAATADVDGAEVPVDDALYFCDGNGMIPGDMITVGSNEPSRLVRVDYGKKTLLLDRPVKCKAGDSVNLAFSGKAPDIGPREFTSDSATGKDSNP